MSAHGRPDATGPRPIRPAGRGPSPVAPLGPRRIPPCECSSWVRAAASMRSSGGFGRTRTSREVVCAPGNPGTAALGRCGPVESRRPDDVLALADRERVDLTVVGPEAPLERGVADLFRRAGRAIVGPVHAGAALECSKVFAKALHGRARDSRPRALSSATRPRPRSPRCRGATFGFPVVVKADGLAAGKGVVVAADRAEAERPCAPRWSTAQFGARRQRARDRGVPDRTRSVVLRPVRTASARSARRRRRITSASATATSGPNTGGMGAFAPSPLVSRPLDARRHATGSSRRCSMGCAPTAIRTSGSSTSV